MHRFFVPPETLRSDRVTLTGAQARQIATVLRLRGGDEITLVADGAEAVVALETVRPASVTGSRARARLHAGASRRSRSRWRSLSSAGITTRR